MQLGSIVYNNIFASGLQSGAANNGLSVSNGIVQLGNAVGGTAAILLNNREIPFGNFSLTMSGLGVAAGSRLNLKYGNTTSLEPSLVIQDSAGNDQLTLRTGANDDFGVYLGLFCGLATTGSANILIGANAGRNITTGTLNIGIGSSVLRGTSASAIACVKNVAVGGDIFNVAGSLLGNFNTGLGTNNFDNASNIGDNNIVIGSFNNNTNGGNVLNGNIVIGNFNGIGNNATNSTIILPLGTGVNFLQLSNVVILGDSTQNTILGSSTAAFVDNGSRLQVIGSYSLPRRTTAVNTALAAADFMLVLTAGALVITLPAAAAAANRIYAVVNQAAASTFNINYINFAGAAVNTIAANAAIWLQSDGANWQRIV